MNPGEASDGELLAATRSRPEAFAAFYDRYETSVVGYFTRRTGDPEVAADLTAEVFAAALGAAHRYRPETPTAAGWLFTIARNTLAKSVRRVAAMRASGFTAFEQTIMDSGEPDRVIAMREDFQRVTATRYRQTIEELTDRKVLAFASQAHVEPDITMEIFVIDSPLEGFGAVEVTEPD